MTSPKKGFLNDMVIERPDMASDTWTRALLICGFATLFGLGVGLAILQWG